MHPSACIVLFGPDGKALVLRRSATDPWMPGRWNFPGGRVDAGETAQQGILRELYEEAGIKLPRRKLRWAFSYRDHPGVTHVFWAKLDKRPRVVSHDGEHDAALWRKLFDIPQPTIPPVRYVVEALTGRTWNLAPAGPPV